MRLNEITGKKMIRNILRRSESLGVQVLPLTKMGPLLDPNSTNAQSNNNNNNNNNNINGDSDYCEPPDNTPYQKWYVCITLINDGISN